MSDRISVWGIGIKFTALTLGYSFAIIFIILLIRCFISSSYSTGYS
jgi:hypothetical protein